MPVKLRCKRYFVLQTVDGPLVTVNPTPQSVLPASFKKAKTRSLAASHEAGGLVAAGSGDPRRSGKDAEGKKDQTNPPPPTTRHAGGGAVLEFSPIMPIPGSFGVPADDEELLKRERLGTVDRQACALCAHMFDKSKLQFLVSRKAVVEQRARWGRNQLRGKDVTPANVYTPCQVCLFCYQFFEELVQGSSSWEDTAPHQHHRSTTITTVHSATAMTSSSWGGDLTAGHRSYLAVPDNLSAPEYLEELRILSDQRRSQRMLNCLQGEWEVEQRRRKSLEKKMRICDHRRREAARLRDEVDRVRRLMSSSNNPTDHCDAPSPPLPDEPSSILTQRMDDGDAHVAHQRGHQASPWAPEEPLSHATMPLVLSVSVELQGCQDAAVAGGARGGPMMRHASDHEVSTSHLNNSTTSTSDGGGAPFKPHRQHHHSQQQQAHRPLSPAADPSRCSLDHRANDDETALELAEDDGEIELTDDLRAILAATPRSARGLHNTGEPSPYLVAREKLLAARNSRRPGTADPVVKRAPMDRQEPSSTKAHRLRREASAISRIRLEEEAYLRDCERRGMHPSQSRLGDFARRVEEEVGRGGVGVGHRRPTSAQTRIPEDRNASQNESMLLAQPTKQAATLLKLLKRQKCSRLSLTDTLAQHFTDRADLLDPSKSASFRADSAAFQNGTKRFSMYTL